MPVVVAVPVLVLILPLVKQAVPEALVVAVPEAQVLIQGLEKMLHIMVEAVEALVEELFQDRPVHILPVLDIRV
jgi:hypothetical protein